MPYQWASSTDLQTNNIHKNIFNLKAAEKLENEKSCLLN